MGDFTFPPRYAGRIRPDKSIDVYTRIYYHYTGNGELARFQPSVRKERSLFEQVLLLNASFEPLNVINWKRAIKLVFLDKVEVVEESDREVHSITVSMKVPSVVRLMGFVRFRRKDAKYSRRNIYARDKYRCQYCNKEFFQGELTCDHVIPRSRGGRTAWDNIVTCCVRCNRKKGGRTPDEAGLRLIKGPTRPAWYWGFQVRFANRRPPRQWWVYLNLYLDTKFEE